MAEVNENLARDNAKCMFVTLFIGVLDLDTGELLYATRAQPPASARRRRRGMAQRHQRACGRRDGRLELYLASHRGPARQKPSSSTPTG